MEHRYVNAVVPFGMAEKMTAQQDLSFEMVLAQVGNDVLLGSPLPSRPTLIVHGVTTVDRKVEIVVNEKRLRIDERTACC
jgi:hypothetical protein